MKIIALAGNPNVGKSTVFNTLTGLHQHTGNWAGKTVSNASGKFKYNDNEYLIYDLPGTYSLISHSKEESVARNYICFGTYDTAVIVCDAVCLERNLNLVLQTLEITKNVIVCVNLIDEAKKKNIDIDINKLSKILDVPVVATSARNNIGIDELLDKLSKDYESNYELKYSNNIEEEIENIIPYLGDTKKLNKRWLAINLINFDEDLYDEIKDYLNCDLLSNKVLKYKVEEARNNLFNIKEEIVNTIVKKSEEISKEVVTFNDENYNLKDKKIDKFLTNKVTGTISMFCLLLVIFWITINGANYPSSILFDLFSKLEIYLLNLFEYLNIPSFLTSLLISGVYKVLTWVIAVMLPPMAIFFPLFTLLEDLGYLPRIAFNLDGILKKCNACGKQALIMCMGFGCNAVGVEGARIIDSKRERLIAILTNVFVPCNGRFPTMITIITIFLVGLETNIFNSFLSVLILTLVILFGIFITFVVSYILSKTILKGYPSSFTLELPPYRKPQIGKVIIRSILDRTIFVLGRAVIVAIPAGALIWLLANINIGGLSLLSHFSNILNPLGNLMGLDGIILMAFILGFPANEIVVPIMLMGYMNTGTLIEYESLLSLKELLVNNGWTIKTAICMLVFSLCHYPCSTTCLTIKKETNFKWMILSIIIPTFIGIILCMIINMF
ncbi:MAG: ferrous iron transport protein B [Bacilli bacterium]|nr:ferrous iron transport protein B [Bacilli bacterium]